jgi:hypothetical protein
MKTKIYKNGLQRVISHTHIAQYTAAGWTESAAVSKKTKTQVAVAAAEDSSPVADSGSPEALASVTTQAQPGDIILHKGDE